MAKSVSTIINEMGGPGSIAAALKMRPETVRMWRHRNRIPRSVWPDVQKAFPKITLEALLQAERAAKRDRSKVAPAEVGA